MLKHKTKKHSPIYQWLVIVDILKALVMLPMSIVSGYYGKWLFDQLGCDISGFSCTFCGFGHLCTLALLTIEKFLSVKYPRKMKRIPHAAKISKF